MLLLIRLDSRCSATARIVSAADEEEEGGPELDLGENGDAAAAVLSHFVSSSPLPPLFSSALFSSGRKPRSTFCAAAAGMATPAPRAAPSSDDRRRAEAGEPAGRAPRPKTAPVTAAASAESATSAGSPRATPEPSWRAQNRAAREPKRPAPLVFDFFVEFLVFGLRGERGEKQEKNSSPLLFPPKREKKISDSPDRFAPYPHEPARLLLGDGPSDGGGGSFLGAGRRRSCCCCRRRRRLCPPGRCCCRRLPPPAKGGAGPGADDRVRRPLPELRRPRRNGVPRGNAGRGGPPGGRETGGRGRESRRRKRGGQWRRRRCRR